MSLCQMWGLWRDVAGNSLRLWVISFYLIKVCFWCVCVQGLGVAQLVSGFLSQGLLVSSCSFSKFVGKGEVRCLLSHHIEPDWFGFKEQNLIFLKS